MRKIIELYKKSLKPIEIEEIFDAYFFRVFGFLIALPFSKTELSPNYFTLISMVLGFTSGLFFLKGWLKLGAIFLIFSNIFDCADGQLARLNRKTSKFGKTLDGLADYITYIAVYTGISYYLYLMKGYSILICFYSFISMLFMFLHIIYFDHFKNEYIAYVLYPKYKEKAEDINILKKQVLLFEKKDRVKWLLALFYLAFYKIEYFFASFGYPKNYKGFISKFSKKRPSLKLKNLYKNNMKIFVRLLTFVGATSHMILFIIFALINKPIYIFHFISIVYNIYLAIVLIFQKRKLSEMFD